MPPELAAAARAANHAAIKRGTSEPACKRCEPQMRGCPSVQVVTVNDYLARRDSEWVGQVPRFLGLQVRCAPVTCGPVALPAQLLRLAAARRPCSSRRRRCAAPGNTWLARPLRVPLRQ